MIKGLKAYLKYIYSNFITGNYTLAILMIITISLYTFLFANTFIISAAIELIIGTAICISYSHYNYDKKFKEKK